MAIEDKYLDETMKQEIKSIHYWVTREIEEVQDILDKIPRDYEFQDSLLRNKLMDIRKYFADVKSSLSFLNKRAHAKMVFNKKE
jgi:hypothetical protein